MYIVGHWVRDALYNLRRDFLTTVLRLTSLFFAFDKSSAISCIKKAYDSLLHSQLLHPDDSEYVVEDIVKFFDDTHHICVSAALGFLRYV